MGLFWNRNKDKAVPPVPKQAELTKEEVKQPVVPQDDSKVQPQPVSQPQPTAKPEAAPAQPQNEIEMRKLVFRLSSKDPAKCDAFIKEILRKINKHDWHNLSGRIGKNVDGIRMRIDIKGKHDDIQSFIRWFKLDYHGVHAYEVMESELYKMTYMGFPPFQEQKLSWSTH